jgi:putative heme iron utilization protein
MLSCARVGGFGLQRRVPNTMIGIGVGRGLSLKAESGHSAPANMAQPQISSADQKLIEAFQKHQQGAAVLPMADQVRTLIDRSMGYGTLSTNSKQFPGFPTGSVVGFELDESGLPFFVFSSMSAHTGDILQDGRVSLTVLASDFKGAAEGRVVLIGTVKKLEDKQRQSQLREKYLARHKDAYWIDFGDFTYFSMVSLELIRYVGGFAMAGSVTPEDYIKARSDPIAAFSAPVMKHMNDDHADSTAAMVTHYAGVPCTSAEIVSMDRLGMTVKAKLEIAGGGMSKVRLPFPGGEVTDRKAIKEVLVAMTRASASAASGGDEAKQT